MIEMVLATALALIAAMTQSFDPPEQIASGEILSADIFPQWVITGYVGNHTGFLEPEKLIGTRQSFLLGR